jgi:hypothetical protein
MIRFIVGGVGAFVFFLVALLVILIAGSNRNATTNNRPPEPTEWSQPELGGDPSAYRRPCVGPFCPF